MTPGLLNHGQGPCTLSRPTDYYSRPSTWLFGPAHHEPAQLPTLFRGRQSTPIAEPCDTPLFRRSAHAHERAHVPRARGHITRTNSSAIKYPPSQAFALIKSAAFNAPTTAAPLPVRCAQQSGCIYCSVALLVSFRSLAPRLCSVNRRQRGPTVCPAWRCRAAIADRGINA